MALIVIMNSSCGTQRYCQPSKKSKDYARQWVRVRSDGYYVHTRVTMKDTKVTVYECLPDSLMYLVKRG